MLVEGAQLLLSQINAERHRIGNSLPSIEIGSVMPTLGDHGGSGGPIDRCPGRLTYLNAPARGSESLPVMAQDAYTNGLLHPEGIEQCYPLALLDWPELTLERWRRFCSACIAARGGRGAARTDILVTTDVNGFFRAFCAFAPHEDATATRHLVVSRLSVAQVVDPVSPATALLGQLQEIARTTGCRSIVLTCTVYPEWEGALRREFDVPVEQRDDRKLAC